MSRRNIWPVHTSNLRCDEHTAWTGCAQRRAASGDCQWVLWGRAASGYCQWPTGSWYWGRAWMPGRNAQWVLMLARTWMADNHTQCAQWFGNEKGLDA
eukprot:478583-Pelagomonas_calceolata.AAC.1